MVDLVTASIPQQPVLAGGLPAAQKPLEGKVEAVVLDRMDKIIEAKQAHIDRALATKMRRWNPPLILGDIFTIGYLILQAVGSVGPVNFAFGVAGGVINLGVALYCLYEAVIAFQAGEIRKGGRLLSDFVALMALSTIMIFGSLALKVAAFSAMGAFFAANPWLLTLCFLLLTVPLTIELGIGKYQYRQLLKGLQLEELEELLERGGILGLQYFTENLFKEGSPLYLKEKIVPIDIGHELSERMKELQENVQAEAAVKIFELARELLAVEDSEVAFDQEKREEILSKVRKAQKALAAWDRGLNIRLFQQFVYFVGFGAAAAAQQGAMLLLSMVANVIALGMDAHPKERWALLRNTPIKIDALRLDENGQCGCKGKGCDKIRAVSQEILSESVA